MSKNPWSAKRERQYAHIKESLIERGNPVPLAEEVAARVVNKERAQHGESVTASTSSINDMSFGRLVLQLSHGTSLGVYSDRLP